MNDFIDERRYAWRMIRAARQAQAVNMQVNGSRICYQEIAGLLDQALDAGLGRTEIIAELADLGARLFALCCPDDAPAVAEAIERDIEADAVEFA